MKYPNLFKKGLSFQDWRTDGEKSKPKDPKEEILGPVVTNEVKKTEFDDVNIIWEI